MICSLIGWTFGSRAKRREPIPRLGPGKSRCRTLRIRRISLLRFERWPGLDRLIGDFQDCFRVVDLNEVDGHEGVCQDFRRF